MWCPNITYGKMKTYYPFQIIDLRFQVDHISPKKIRLFEKCDENPVNTILYSILIKHREIKMVSDGIKIFGVEVMKTSVLLYLYLYLSILTIIRVVIHS